MASGASSATEGMGCPPSFAALQNSSCKWPILIALGIIVSLGGVFLVLAAYQVLPTGVNAISDLGIWGKVLGFGTLGLGVLITLVSGVKQCLVHQQSQAIPIPAEVKKTLGSFLGGPRVVDRLPTYPGVADDGGPPAAAMTAPIMKGVLSGVSGNRPFIALKLRRLSDEREVRTKHNITPVTEQHYDFTKTEQIVLLVQTWGHEPCYWLQQFGGMYEITPRFLPYFADPNTGGKPTPQSENGRNLLRTLVANGEGEDLHGVRWKLIKDH
ncbi:hypothetical protein ACFLR2_01045 [Chlamydiota bacterium]